MDARERRRGPSTATISARLHSSHSRCHTGRLLRSPVRSSTRTAEGGERERRCADRRSGSGCGSGTVAVMWGEGEGEEEAGAAYLYSVVSACAPPLRSSVSLLPCCAALRRRGVVDVAGGCSSGRFSYSGGV